MGILHRFVVAAAMCFCPLSAIGFEWQMATDPGTLGWSREKLLQAEKYASGLQTESVMIIHKDGSIVHQWGPTDRAFDVFSVRKSMVSLLYGMYAEAGKIDLSSTLQELGIDDRQKLTQAEQQARILHLLKSRSGVYHPAAWETPGMIANRLVRGSKEPDEHWYYNNWDFNALNSIFRMLTGMTVNRALEEALAGPLGFEDFGPRHSFMLYEEVSDHPSALLWMSARDLGRVGLMLLNRGQWEGRRIVSSEWIEESTAAHSDLDILGGYGYSWWAAIDGMHFPFVTLPAGSFSARGTGEQVLLVIPEWDTVIVHRGRVCGPGSSMMHVTEFGHLLARILDAREPREP